jgi:tRNA(Phe) wybutosine-synthesizing methylase Tyw3
MTPLLPEDMMKKIFEMWREHLKKNKDSMFRTVQQLESDQEKLLKISKQRNMKAGGK